MIYKTTVFQISMYVCCGCFCGFMNMVNEYVSYVFKVSGNKTA